MTVYNDALWAEATFDHEAAHDAEIMGAAQVAGAEVWSVLASAESSEDFHTRLALMEPRIHAVAASIATEGSPDYTRIIAALPARFFEDWTLLAEARQREAQARNAPRAAAWAAAREASRTVAYKGQDACGPCTKAMIDGTEHSDCTHKSGNNKPGGCGCDMAGHDWDEFFGKKSASLSSIFASNSPSADFMTPEGAPEARPMEEAVKDPALDETDPVRWKQSAAEEKVCETCSHPLWWNEERGEYVHRGEYGDHGHKPNPVSKQSARWPWQRTADVWGVQPDGAVYDPRKKAAAPPSDLYELAKARWGGAQAKDYQGGKGFMADGYLYVFTKPNRGPYSSTPADVEWCMEANDGAGVDFRRTADGGWEYHGLTEVINNEGWKKLGSNRLASDGWKKLAYGDEHILSQEEKEGLREVKWGTLKPGDRFINLGMGTKTMVGNDGRVQFLYGVEHGGTVWTVKSVNEDGTITAVNHLGKEQTGAPPNPSTQTVTKMAARKQAVGDNSWPPKEGGEKEGGDPKAPPAAPGAPQAPVPTATEQAQPGQPGTPASGITVGTVLLDHVDGIISTYEVSNVVDEGETVLVSVTKNGGEQMDLRIPKTETVQTYQTKGDDAAAPVEQPEGAPSANPFADKAAEGEAKPEGGDDPKPPAQGEEKKPEGDKPKDDEDPKKKGNPFAKGSAKEAAGQTGVCRVCGRPVVNTLTHGWMHTDPKGRGVDWALQTDLANGTDHKVVVV